jgi:hypothetical protein
LLRSPLGKLHHLLAHFHLRLLVRMTHLLLMSLVGLL